MNACPPQLSGKTRLFFIVGDPIAQVKAPSGVTAELQRRGHDAIVVPIHVAPEDVDGFLDVAARLRNVDGMFATVPHKFAAFRHCRSSTERARFLGSANLLRRNPDGSWHGDMSDGGGFVAAVRQAGGVPAGKRVLQAGAGGAGSAIAYELLQAGVAELALHDEDAARRDALLRRLEQVFPGKAKAGLTDPRGYDLLVNATPSGMRPDDAPAFETGRLDARMFVGDVVTVPEITPLLAAARRLGCRTSTGVDMFNAQLAMMVDFLLHA